MRLCFLIKQGARDIVGSAVHESYNSTCTALEYGGTAGDKAVLNLIILAFILAGSAQQREANYCGPVTVPPPPPP